MPKALFNRRFIIIFPNWVHLPDLVFCCRKDFLFLFCWFADDRNDRPYINNAASMSSMTQRSSCDNEEPRRVCLSNHYSDLHDIP